MKQTRCIICGERKDGLAVREDFILSRLRWIKRNITKDEKGYTLVVCKACYPAYEKSRKRFVRRQLTYSILGVIFAAVIVLAGQNKLLAVIFGLVVFVVLFALSLLSYMPSLDLPKSAQRG